MPQWIHDRARHIRDKNPDMSEGMSWAIATQQSHSLGKSPKGYGTSEGRKAAKEKYPTPGDDTKTADPKEKKAWAGLTPRLAGFADELQKIAMLDAAPIAPPASPLGSVKSTSPKPLTSPSATPKYTKVNSDTPRSPIASAKPVLDAPPVRT